MKVYVVYVTHAGLNIDHNPVKGIYDSVEKAKQHFDDLVDYCGTVPSEDDFQYYHEDSSTYIAIEEWSVEWTK